MTSKILTLLKRNHALVIKSVGEFETFKAKGMTFNCKAYEVCGLGHVSVMQAKGFFGLMKMDTLMIVPGERDLPLYSYDRIFAMGNDTLIVELYDTLVSPLDASSLDQAKEHYQNLAERAPGEHWYDSIKLPQSISKKGKKSKTPSLNALASDHFAAYLSLPAGKTADQGAKANLSLQYVEGLLHHGGPSTDVFKKALGQEKTEQLFKKVLFGVA